MDPSAVAVAIMSVLAPALPYLKSAGEELAKKAAEELGQAALGKAKALWAKLGPKLEARAGASEMIDDLANNPEDEGARAGVLYHLKKVANDDPEFAKELYALARDIADTPGSRITIASGERAVAIGGDAKGNVIITGDKNTER